MNNKIWVLSYFDRVSVIQMIVVLRGVNILLICLYSKEQQLWRGEMEHGEERERERGAGEEREKREIAREDVGERERVDGYFASSF